MSDLTPITLHRKPGMPPDGAKGRFIAWDPWGVAHIMVRNRFGWQISGFDHDDLAKVITLSEAGKSMMVAHTQLPEPAR